MFTNASPMESGNCPSAAAPVVAGRAYHGGGSVSAWWVVVVVATLVILLVGRVRLMLVRVPHVGGEISLAFDSRGGRI